MTENTVTETTVSDKPRKDWYSIFLSVISLALAVLVVLLVLQNRDLKDKLRAAAQAGPPGGLQAGETLPSFALADASGAPTQVPVGDGRRRLAPARFRGIRNRRRAQRPHSSWARHTTTRRPGARRSRHGSRFRSAASTRV